jgi:hypothetical protein
MKKLVLVLAATAALMLALPLAATAAPANPQVQTVWKATGTWVRSLQCVSQARIQQLDDHAHSSSSRFSVWGLTAFHSRRVWLDQRMCQAITTQSGWYISALTLIGHEASHARGVHGEGRAECYGVRFAYAYMNKTGQMADYGESRIRQYLLDDSGRPREYKLRGRCGLTGSFRWGI